MAKKIKYVIGIISVNDNANTIKYVTSINTNTNVAKWESNKEAKTFESKSYAEDVAFGLCANGFNAVVMIKPDYITFKNPSDYVKEQTNDTWISGIVQTHKDGSLGYCEGFNLTEEEENAIWKILEKHDTEGCSIRGSREDIAKEFIE